MEQYFIVGEEVELVSLTYPEMNGDAVISHVIVRDSNSEFKCPVTGQLFYASRRKFSANAVCYYLHGIMIDEDGRPNLWSQSALRKKHPKGDSFDTIMKTLNQGVTA